MFKNFGKKSGHFDYIFVFCVAALAVFGLIMLSSASSDLGKIKFNDTYYYLKHQIFYGLIFGAVGFLLTSRLHYKNWNKLAAPLLIANVILLILIFTPLGVAHKGASRWLNLGFFSAQPAEFLKITFIVYLAAWLSNKKINRQESFYAGFIPFIAISGFIAALVFFQPATTIIIIVMLAGLIVYFLSGAKLSHIAGIIILGIVGLSLLIYASGYRSARIINFIRGGDELGDNYQTIQSLNAIGSGGIWGVGFGKSTTKYKFLPEPIGDSIFAVIAEELGFSGVSVLMAAYCVLFWRGFAIARKSTDQFAKLLTVGLISIIAVQTFIHIGAISGIMPLTGVPLPLISYGGSALMVFLTMSGIIANISKYTS